MTSLIVDVRAYAADAKARRNILNSRTAVAGSGESRRDFELVQSASPVVLPCTTGNLATIFMCSAQVRLTIRSGASSIDLDVNGTLVLPAAVTGLEVLNSNAQVSCSVIQQFAGTGL